MARRPTTAMTGELPASSGKRPGVGFPEAGHNHGSCETSLLDRASSVFKTTGMKLTDLRRRVLEEIAASHEALGAYEILDRLSAKGPRLAPISVYRAIDALHAAGLVHRLESRNAFFACHEAHAPQREHVVLACEQCGRVAEFSAEPVFAELRNLIERADFEPRRMVTEISGTCVGCRTLPSSPEH